MKVTVDANILFSALLKKGFTRKILFDQKLVLVAPAYSLVEFSKYKPYLRKKFIGNTKEFQTITSTLIEQIEFITDQELSPYLYAAKTLTTDKKDWLYLACALKEDTIIWSNDKEFKKQKRIKIKTTEEMIKEFGKL